MAGEPDKTPASAGILAPEEVDVDALFARLQEEVRRGGSAPVEGDRSARLAWRDQAERMWSVSAERPIRRQNGVRGFIAYGVKKALRPFLRWYVEPLAAEQRGYNDALLKLVDELSERADLAAAREEAARRSLTELEERLARVERRPAAGGAQAPAQTVAAQPAGRRRPSRTTSPTRRRCAARPRQSASASASTSTNSAMPRPCSTSAAGAASCSGSSATPASRRAVSTPTPTWSPTRAARASTSSRRTRSRTSSRSTTARSAASSPGRSSSTCRRAALLRLLELAALKLRPGGLLVAETINPLSPLALRSYFADLTHAQPLVPETLALLARQAGFREVETRFLNEPAERLDDPGRPHDRRQRAQTERHPLRPAGLRDPRPEMRIAVCRPQVPFSRGGAEIFTDELVRQLRARGHEAEIVSVPFKWYPGQRVLTQAFLWRLLDLTEADGRPIDLVVATKFPSYCIRHPNKVVWLLHQFRQAYELDRTGLGQFSESAEDRATRRRVQRLDRTALGEARRLFATSGTSPSGCSARPAWTPRCLPHPPQELAYRTDAYEPFVFSVGRLDRAKRIDLLIEAAARQGVDARDLGRGAGPRAARAARERARPLHRPRFRGRSWQISTPAAARSSTRRSTRTSGWSPSRPSWPRSRW